MVSTLQAGLISVMLNPLPKAAPGVNSALVMGTGATDLQEVFSKAQDPNILVAYIAGLKILLRGWHRVVGHRLHHNSVVPAMGQAKYCRYRWGRRNLMDNKGHQ